jgi:hypothetical protein
MTISNNTILKQEAALETTSVSRLKELAEIDINLARIVAKNSMTSSELLQQLASSSDKFVLEAVTSNPNTPPEVLLELGKRFTKKFIENPCLPLMLLENPNLFKQLPLKTINKILSNENAPDFLLKWASNQDNPDVLFALLKNTHIYGEILADVVNFYFSIKGNGIRYSEYKKNHNYNDVLLALVNHPETPAESLEKLANLSDDIGKGAKLHINLRGEITDEWDKIATEVIQDWSFSQDVDFDGLVLLVLEEVPKYLTAKLFGLDIANYLVSQANTSADYLEIIFSEYSNNHHIIHHLAQHPNTPPQILEKLAEFEEVTIRAAVAENPNLGERSLLALLEDKSSDVRNAAIKNPSISMAVIDELEWRKNHQQREAIAQNPSVPLSVLKFLVEDENCNVRTMLAKNPTIPVNLLSTLAEDESYRVRLSVAENINTPKTVLEKLGKDEFCFVRQGVAKNPKTPGNLLSVLLEEYSLEVAANPNTSQKILSKLSLNGDEKIKIAVAGNPSTSKDDLELLAKDESHLIRAEVAKNINTSVHVLTNMVNDTASYVRLQLAQNPNMKNHKEDIILYALKNSGKSDKPLFNRFVACLSSRVPVNVLKNRYDSKYWVERYAIAQNPQTPANILEHLQKDSNSIVRAFARANSSAKKM